MLDVSLRDQEPWIINRDKKTLEFSLENSDDVLNKNSDGASTDAFVELENFETDDGNNEKNNENKNNEKQ